MQILVLGMHRSGTSAVTRLINMMGAYFGTQENSLGANDENPKGFWERRDVVECNKSILHEATGSEWDDLSRWKDASKIAATPEHVRRMQLILDEMDGHSPWVMKDPRLCLTLPLWRKLLRKPVSVLVYRDPLEIARSLETRNKIPSLLGLALWEYYTVSMLNAVRDLPCIYVKHAELMRDPVFAVKKLYDSLNAHGMGLSMPKNEDIESFVEPSLYRSKVEDREAHKLLSAEQQALIALLKGEALLEKPLEVSARSREWMGVYGYLAAARRERDENARCLKEETRRFQQEKDALMGQMDIIRQENAGLLNRVTQLMGDLEAVHRSASWKIGNRIVRLGALVMPRYGKKQIG